MPQKKFTNPYHFVPVERPDNSQNREHWLDVNSDFENRQLGHYSHAQYHPDTYSGRLICRLTTEDAMFVGASAQADEHKKEPAQAKPFELIKGQPAIPASTLRGLLSSIVETASNSALRVLHDQVLSYRMAMKESLSALGMIVAKPDEDGNISYSLKPLTLPTLIGNKNQGYTYTSEYEKKAYIRMFGKKEARLKVYINGYKKDKSNGFIKGKSTFCKTEFYYAKLGNHPFSQKTNHPLSLRHDDLLHIKSPKFGKGPSFVIGQKHESLILSHDEWKALPPGKEKNSYTRGILRILGKEGRDMPKEKTHEIFIPYPSYVENCNPFPILPEAIERFHQLADECTKLMEEKAEREGKVFEDMTPAEKDRWLTSLLPYHLKGTERNDGCSKWGNKLRIKAGDLVYFRPTMLQNGEPVVAEIAFSSIWRGRVEDVHGKNASVYRFFEQIDPELLPFHQDRRFISPAELLFGFTQKDEDEKGKKKADRNADGRALAGRVQVSFGQLAPGQSSARYQEQVLLKSLLSPKLPCPMMYFKTRYTKEDTPEQNNRYTSQEYISKQNLKLGKHRPPGPQKDVEYQPQGRKMYVHSHRDNGSEPWKSLDDQNNRNLKTYVTPIRKNTEFYFHIDFNNLNEWELGMLCYALRPSAEFRHKLGMGKGIGLGKVRIDPVGLFLIDREKRYRTTDIFETPRYHAVWTEENFKWPTDYTCEQKAVEQTKTSAPHWENLRELFRETIPANIQNALELLGNPDKVSAVVHTPQVAGKEGPELEQESFQWFVENDNEKKSQHETKSQQMLKPLDENSTELPTFNR